MASHNFLLRRSRTLFLLLSIAAGLCVGLTLQACGTTEIVYARATKAPEETAGFMRIATEEPIKVNVVGTNAVAERPLAGYIVIHESDLAALIDLAASRPVR